MLIYSFRSPVEVVIEVDPDYQGSIIEALGSRKADMKDLQMSAVGTVRMEFHIASRALLGFRSELLRMTHGTGIMSQIFYEYQPYKGDIPHRSAGSDETINLVPPKEMTLEFIEDDELVEVTPKNIRLRKRFLTDNERRAARNQAKRA